MLLLLLRKTGEKNFFFFTLSFSFFFFLCCSFSDFRRYTASCSSLLFSSFYSIFCWLLLSSINQHCSQTLLRTSVCLFLTFISIHSLQVVFAAIFPCVLALSTRCTPTDHSLPLLPSSDRPLQNLDPPNLKNKKKRKENNWRRFFPFHLLFLYYSFSNLLASGRT